MKPNFEPGDLVQLMKGVVGQGEVGVLIGPDDDQYRTQWLSEVVKVMFHDGIHVCHMSNLQKPDGRLKPRR